jgi:hypothetical protein
LKTLEKQGIPRPKTLSGILKPLGMNFGKVGQIGCMIECKAKKKNENAPFDLSLRKGHAQRTELLFSSTRAVPRTSGTMLAISDQPAQHSHQ